MEKGSKVRVMALVLVAGSIGYLVGPPIAQAVGSGLVRIASGTKGSQAKIFGGKVMIDTEADVVTGAGGVDALATSIQGTVPQVAGGQEVLGEGTTTDSSVLNCDGATLATVVVHDPTWGATVEVRADADGDGSSSDLVWKGTAGAGGHLNDTFDGGIGFDNTLSVTVTDGPAQWILYGSNPCS